MPRKTKSREKLDAVRHPTLLWLSKERIGPIFPSAEELKGILRGMRGVPRRKTKSPFNLAYRENRRKKNRVSANSRRRNGYA